MTSNQPSKAHHISADHLRLCIGARKARPQTRFAAMANHTVTLGSCGRPTCNFATGPLFGPMERGRLHDAIDRLKREHGLPVIRKTFGINYRRLLAEPRHIVPAVIG